MPRGAAPLNHGPDQARISAPNLRHSNRRLSTLELASKDADNLNGKDDVERAYIPELSSIAESLSKVSSVTQRLANRLWLKEKVDPVLVFNILHLGEAATKLDNNPRFLVWLKYVDMYAGLRIHPFHVDDIFQLLRKSNSDEQLVSLFQWLRKIRPRKDLAEQMQIYLFERSASSRQLLNAAWLHARETPDEVFKMLHLDRAALPLDKLQDDSKFLHWFIYTEMYWPVKGRDLRTFKFLQNKYDDSEMHIAVLFQAVKQRPELEALGDNLQRFLFKDWVDSKLTPEFVRQELALPSGIAIFKLDTDDVFYRALEEYTVYYAGRLGGEEVLKTVQGLFKNDKPHEALAIATNIAQ